MTDFQRFHPPPCSAAAAAASSSSHQSAKAAAWAWLQRRSVQSVAPSSVSPRFPSAAADHNRSLHSSDVHDLFNQSDRLLQRRHNSFSPTPSRFKPRADLINRSSNNNNNNDRRSTDSSDQSSAVNSCSSNPMGSDIDSPQLFTISSPVSTHHTRMKESRAMSSCSSSWSPTSSINSDSSSGSNYYDRKWRGMDNSDLAWDCGSSLFDCFELVAMAKNLKLDDGICGGMLLQKQEKEGHDRDAWLISASSCGKRQPVEAAAADLAVVVSDRYSEIVQLNAPEDMVVLNPQCTITVTDDHRNNIHPSIESEMLVQNYSSSRSSADVEDQICSINDDSADVVSCADIWNHAAQQVPIHSSTGWASSLFDDFELVVTAKKLEENDMMVDYRFEQPPPPDNLPIHTAHLPTIFISSTTGSISPPDSAHDQQRLAMAMDEVIDQILRHQDAITVSEKDPCVNVDDVRETASDSFTIGSDVRDRCRVITIDDQRINDRSADSYHPTDLGHGAYQEHRGRYPVEAMNGDRDGSSSNLGWDSSGEDHVSKLNNDSSSRAYYTFADLLRPPRIHEEGCFSFPLSAAGTPVKFGALDRVEETYLNEADGQPPALANCPLQMDARSMMPTESTDDREIVVTAETLRAGSCQSRFISGVQSPRRVINHHQPESADAKFSDASFRSTSPETVGCRKNCERQETYQNHLCLPWSPQNDNLKHLKQYNLHGRGGGDVDWEYGETAWTARTKGCSTMYYDNEFGDSGADSGSIELGGKECKHRVQMKGGTARARLRKVIRASMKSVSGLLKASKYRSPAAVDDDRCSSTSCATSDFCSTINTASPSRSCCRSKEPTTTCDEDHRNIHHIHHHHFHYLLPQRSSDASSACGKDQDKFGDVAVLEHHHPSLVAAAVAASKKSIIFNLESNAGADDNEGGDDEILVLVGKGASMSAAAAAEEEDSVERCAMSDHTATKKNSTKVSKSSSSCTHHHHHGGAAGAAPCKGYSLQSTHSLLSAYLTSPISRGGHPRHAHPLPHLDTWPTIH